MPGKNIRVLIADDHAVLRSGLKLLVNAQPDMEVVAEAADGAEAIDRARSSKPDVALLDLTMPGTGGLEALEKLVHVHERLRVVVLTMHDDPAYLRTVLSAGAKAYVLKRSVDSELLSAIRAVHNGGSFVDPSLTNCLVSDLLARQNRRTRGAKRKELLSSREVLVLRMLAQGYTNKEIATHTLISVKTVETYRARILTKLDLRSRSDLVRYAMQMGLLKTENLNPDRRPNR